MAQTVDFMYVATLDDKGVQQAFDRIETRATNLADKLTKSFN